MKRLSACALSLALSVSMILPAGAAGAAFTDVPQDHWANPYVEAMTQKGVVTGVGNGRFNPDGNLSTAEFSVMLTQKLKGELEDTMAMCGVHSLSEITRELIF